MGSSYDVKPLDDEPIYLSDVQRLALNPGDIVVLRCNQRITEAIADRLKQQVRSLVGDHEVMVLSEGVDIGVIATSA